MQRLCKALISAKYLGAAMEAWGEDVVSELNLIQNSVLCVKLRFGTVLPGTLGRDQPQGCLAFTGGSSFLVA